MSKFEFEELLEKVLREDADVQPPLGMERRIVTLASRENKRSHHPVWGVLAACALTACVLAWHPPRLGKASPAVVSRSVRAGVAALPQEEATSLPRMGARSRGGKIKARRMAALRLEEPITIPPIAIRPLVIEPLEVASLSMNESQRER